VNTSDGASYRARGSSHLPQFLLLLQNFSLQWYIVSKSNMKGRPWCMCYVVVWVPTSAWMTGGGAYCTKGIRKRLRDYRYILCSLNASTIMSPQQQQQNQQHQDVRKFRRCCKHSHLLMTRWCKACMAHGQWCATNSKFLANGKLKLHANYE